MVGTQLTGTRIRERRITRGVKQAALAQEVGISASYLNLIEHNRRRIGGKLLGKIAAALDVDSLTLAEGAEASLIAELGEASVAMRDTGVEIDRTEEFAGRFPGWAKLVTAQSRRAQQLERLLENLSDRMSHDPHLAASLHDILSTAAAIGSAAQVLVETKEIEAEWRDRFHRNIHEDSQRLGASSQALVRFLEDKGDMATGARTAQEEAEAWFEARDFHVPELERALPIADDILLAEPPGILSQQARAIAMQMLQQYRKDAAQLPLEAMQDAVERFGIEPLAIAGHFGADVPTVMRRLAQLPTPPGRERLGLVVCDASGARLFRKTVPGFPFPRVGDACALLPLFQALTGPMIPLRSIVESPEADRPRFLAYAIAHPAGEHSFDQPQRFIATMLIVPPDRARIPSGPEVKIGVTCRICPRSGCAARREPSILATP